MKLAVILPVYNSEKYLPECVHSLLNQTFQDFCVIAVNDCSTDSSGDILEYFAKQDNRLRVFHLPKNQGGHVAGEFALDLTKKMRVDYVARMDSDDVSFPNRFEMQIDFLDKHQDITVVGSAVQRLGGDNTVSVPPNSDDLIKAHLMIAAANLLNPTTMWRNTWFREHDIHYGQSPVAEDLAMWLDCAKKGAKFANLSVPLLVYRLHGANASGKIQSFKAQIRTLLCDYMRVILPQFRDDEIRALSYLTYLPCETETVYQSDVYLAYDCISRLQRQPEKSVLGENQTYILQILQAKAKKWHEQVPPVSH